MTSSPFARFLSPDTLIAEIRMLASILTQQGVSFALIGGVAMGVYGSDRLTVDLDFVVDSIPPCFQDAAPLEIGGVQIKTAQGVEVDFVDRNDEYRALYREALAAARPHPGLGGVRVVPAEFLAAMKLAVGREKDLGDLAFLLATPGVLDYAKTRKVVATHLGVYAARELDGYRETAAWERDAAARAARGGR